MAKPSQGAWRLASLTELERVALRARHILIRHRGCTREAPFDLTRWEALGDPPERSREQAIDLAINTLERLTAGADFALLAEEMSEDATTSHQGGSFGGIPASNLSVWPGVLDAMAALGPGRFIGPIETEFGFHIFYRPSEPPSTEHYSGSRIVLGHHGAPWLRFEERSARWHDRSLKDALALAVELRNHITQDPQSFEQVARQYSDHVDGSTGGDMGVWTLVEPTSYPNERNAIKDIQIGEVSQPLLTRQGVVLITRRAVTFRAPLAARTARFGFLPDATSGTKGAEDVVRQTAKQYLSQVLADDTVWFRKSHSVGILLQSEQWEDGRTPAPIRLALESITEGKTYPSVVKDGGELVVVRRAKPGPTRLQKKFDWLPSPKAADVVATLTDVTHREAENIVSDVLQRTAALPSLKDEVAVIEAQLSLAIDQASSREVPENERRIIHYAALDNLQQHLGLESFQELFSVLQLACDSARMKE